MASRRANDLLDNPDRVIHRPPPAVRLRDGRFCRDRLPWNGVNVPDRCDCIGKCQWDRERER